MSLIRRSLERRGFGPGEWGNTNPPTNGSLGGGGAGIGRVSEQTALQITAVYGSVGVIADGIATLSWNRLSSLDPATRKRLPWTQLLRQPYVEISRMDWLTQYAMSMALRGEFFGHTVDRDQDFYPSQVKPVHPDQAQVRRLPSGAVEYTFFGRTVPVDDVVHIRNLSLPGGLRGLNPIEFLRISLGLAVAQERYGASYFRNSANPSGVLETDDELEDDDVIKVARNWMQAHQGVDQANLPAVLQGGMKWNPISISPQDSQFLESRQYSGSDISGKIFRVPPHMIGIVDRSTSWGTGIEQQERGFVTNTLGGYLGRLEEWASSAQPDREYVRFDLSQRLRGDKLQRYQAYSLGVLGGWLCADDILAEEDLPPVPDGLGKNYMVPINSELLKQAMKDAEAASKEAQNVPRADGGTDA